MIRALRCSAIKCLPVGYDAAVARWSHRHRSIREAIHRYARPSTKKPHGQVHHLPAGGRLVQDQVIRGRPTKFMALVSPRRDMEGWRAISRSTQNIPSKHSWAKGP